MKFGMWTTIRQKNNIEGVWDSYGFCLIDYHYSNHFPATGGGAVRGSCGRGSKSPHHHQQDFTIFSLRREPPLLVPQKRKKRQKKKAKCLWTDQPTDNATKETTSIPLNLGRRTMFGRNYATHPLRAWAAATKVPECLRARDPQPTTSRKSN